MNHIEALKVARDALEKITRYTEGSACKFAHEALAATAVIEPVAASIESESFNTRLLCYRSAMAIGSADSDRSAIIRTVDAHCAAQVAQALAAKPAPTDAEIEQVAAIESLGRHDPAVHAFLRLKQRDKMEWPDTLTQMVLHLSKEKAELMARLVGMGRNGSDSSPLHPTPPSHSLE